MSIFFLPDPVNLLTNQAERLTQDEMLMNDRCNGTAYASKEQLSETEKNTGLAIAMVNPDEGQKAGGTFDKEVEERRQFALK